MHPLSIKTGDILIIGLKYNGTLSDVATITAVTGPTTVNNLDSYQVTAGGIVYTCTAANTVAQEKTVNVANSVTTGFVTTWVISA